MACDGIAFSHGNAQAASSPHFPAIFVAIRGQASYPCVREFVYLSETGGVYVCAASLVASSILRWPHCRRSVRVPGPDPGAAGPAGARLRQMRTSSARRAAAGSAQPPLMSSRPANTGPQRRSTGTAGTKILLQLRSSIIPKAPNRRRSLPGLSFPCRVATGDDPTGVYVQASSTACSGGVVKGKAN